MNMTDIDAVANSISELNEGMSFPERILWWRETFGRRAAELLVAEARTFLIRRHHEVAAEAAAARRDIDDYLFLLRTNERVEREHWLAEREEDQEAKAAREAARKEHGIEEYLRRVRYDRAYRARLLDDFDFEEILEMKAKEERDLDDFWNLMLSIAVARALQTPVVRPGQFARFLPSSEPVNAPAAPDGPDTDSTPGMR